MSIFHRELNVDLCNLNLNQRRALVASWLARYSISLLRVSLGLVFLGFGALKFVPGVSPVEDMVSETMSALTLELLPSGVGLALVATLETVIGLLLITGRALRLGLALLGLALVGILSLLVLFPDRLFAGPGNAPTLEGQYVIKDLVLLAAGLVVIAGARGGRIVSDRDAGALGDHGTQPPTTNNRSPQQQRPPERVAA